MTEHRAPSRGSVPVFYPFFVAAYSVLALAAANLHERVRPEIVSTLLLLVLVSTAALWLVARWLVPERHARGLLLLSWVVLFAGYGFLFEPARRLDSFTYVARHGLGLAVVLALAAVAAAAARRLRKGPSGLTGYLNVMAAILLAFPLVTIVRHGLATSSAAPDSAAPQRAAHASTMPPVLDSQVAERRARGPREPLRDIYFIVLDAYSGSRSLQEIYDFDNSSFEAALQERGFVVPRRSRANYVVTYSALAAALDWHYLTDVAERQGPESQDRSPVYDLLLENRTVRLLKSHGYEYIFVRSSYPPLNENPIADVQLPEVLAGEFQRVWLRSTPLVSMAVLACAVVECNARHLPFPTESATEVLRKFTRTGELAARPGLQFVFAHFLLPHPPFVLTEDCVAREPWWPEETDPGADGGLREAYAAQVACTNRQVLALVDRLLATPGPEPIILLQADHGYGRFPLGRPTGLAQAAPGQVVERTDVFAAYHLPAGGGAVIYDSITPVNALRLTLSYYFALGLQPLPDLTYWSASARPYDFTLLSTAAGKAHRPLRERSAEGVGRRPGPGRRSAE